MDLAAEAAVRFSFLFQAVLPECRHVLQCLAFGFGHALPDEQGCKQADDAIQAVSEHRAEIVQSRKGGRHQVVEHPLERYGDGYGFSTDGVGEDLGNENPNKSAPMTS